MGMGTILYVLVKLTYAHNRPIGHRFALHVLNMTWTRNYEYNSFTNSLYRVTPYTMSHTSDDKKLLARISRLKGQLEAVERALEKKAPCGEILNLVASVRGAVNGLTVELIEEHVREHVSNPETDTDEKRAQGATDLIQVIRTYLK